MVLFKDECVSLLKRAVIPSRHVKRKHQKWVCLNKMGNKSGYTSFKTKLSLWSTHYGAGGMRYNHPVAFSVWRKPKCNQDININTKQLWQGFLPQTNDNLTVSTMSALTVISTAVFFPYLVSASAPHRRSAPRSQKSVETQTSAFPWGQAQKIWKRWAFLFSSRHPK